MSVCLFGVEELGRVLRWIAPDIRTRDVAAYERAAENLATISRANTACFNDRYREKERPSTADEIIEAAQHNRGPLGGIVSTVGLFRYNCTEDRDYLEEEPGGMKALAMVLEALLWRLHEAGEEKARHG